MVISQFWSLLCCRQTHFSKVRLGQPHLPSLAFCTKRSEWPQPIIQTFRASLTAFDIKQCSSHGSNCTSQMSPFVSFSRETYFKSVLLIKYMDVKVCTHIIVFELVFSDTPTTLKDPWETAELMILMQDSMGVI